MFSPVQSTDRSAVVVCLTDQIGNFFRIMKSKTQPSSSIVLTKYKTLEELENDGKKYR